jgi:hypothetical protein
MDDLRKFALDIAATAIRGAPFTEIVRAAEAFHTFLSGEPQIAYVDEHGTAYSDDNTPIRVFPKRVFPKRCKGLVGGSLNPNVPPPNNTDLGEADQSPAMGFASVTVGGTNAPISVQQTSGTNSSPGCIGAIDPDDTPTRLVRREDLPPDAA